MDQQSVLRRTEYHFAGATGYELFARSWLPAEPERAVVLVHGYAEHTGRYDHVAGFLGERGCAVHAYDQQGHGRSEGVPCPVRRFSHFLDDLEGFVARVRAECGALPLFVLGHSMGGLIVASYARERAPDVAGVATSGAALALSDALPRGQMLAAKLVRWVAPRLAVSSGLDPDALSRDPEVVRAYLGDPLVYRKMTTSLAAEMLGAIGRAAGGGAAVRVPMLLMHGEADALCPVSGSREFYESLTLDGKRLCTYPELRHEIFNEPERETVLGDLVDWLRSTEARAGVAA